MISTLAESNLRKLPKYSHRITLDLRGWDRGEKGGSKKKKAKKNKVSFFRKKIMKTNTYGVMDILGKLRK